MAKKIAAANWKLFKTPAQAKSFLQEFLPESTGLKSDVIIFPQALSAFAVSIETAKAGNVKWGGQNGYFENQGAFTGENSMEVLKAMGASYVLIGHSERRKLFGETEEMLNKKVRNAQSLGLIPMLCVGEDLEQRERGETEEIIVTQLKNGFKGAVVGKPIVVAYEPVWAIGTGKVATVQQAEEAHAILRETISHIGGPADEISILYGGSVKPDNAVELAKQKNIDGFLVGGASLEAKSFLAIAKALS